MTVKKSSHDAVLQAESLVGMAMTYTLFEYAKENVDELMENHQISAQVFYQLDNML